MKVILCLHHFLPEYVGGTEIYTLRLAQQLKQLNVEPVILIPNFDSLSTSEYSYENVRVIKYAENSIEDRKMIMGKKAPDGLRIFTDILSAEKPDIIHFHELAPGRGINIFHVEKARQLNIPVVLTFHQSSYTCFIQTLVYKGKEKCDGIIRIKQCTECVFNSKNLKGNKARLLSRASETLFALNLDPTKLNTPWGTALGFPYVINKIKKDLVKLSNLAEQVVVLTEWYKKVLEKNGIPSSKLTLIQQGLTNEIPGGLKSSDLNFPLEVVYIGRISRLKGLHLLIDAICQLPEEKVSLFIYGKETEDDYAIKCKEKTLLKKNFHWMGSIPSKEVIRTLSQHHILCLPSDFEMSPLVIQEAFAAGLPVLASDVYGNAEQIKEGVNGWLFNFKDSAHLAFKLQCLINDIKLIEKVRSNLPGPYLFQEIARVHLNLYSSINRGISNNLVPV